MKQLSNPRGLPVYFKTEALKDGRILINCADTEKCNVGDIVSIRNPTFKVEEIKEERPCVLDYGQGDKPLYFQSLICIRNHWI